MTQTKMSVALRQAMSELHGLPGENSMARAGQKHHPGWVGHGPRNQRSGLLRNSQTEVPQSAGQDSLVIQAFA
ncbi:hypothetical protein J2W96_006212 [Variovorax guangxiensis]|nr:hypothetical protein [Variovorax guangxiensis]